MVRPFWSGQFRVSLVSFGIQLFPATDAKGEIHFHQLNRRTGERVRHQNVTSEDDPVDKDEIVKGYEYSKGEYVMIEPEDIENLRIPSRQTLDVAQFVGMDELDPEYFEKPYFVAPENPGQAEAFAVVRKAMQSSGKVALGKIAFGGREHIVAISAPKDDKEPGMMAYILRYASELRDSAQYFGDIKHVAIDQDQLALAKELIKRKTAPFKAVAFQDEYETALRAMVEAKVKHVSLPWVRMRSMNSQPSLLSFSSPFSSQKRFLPFSLMETLVCMPLPLTPTTGLGRKEAVKPILVATSRQISL